MKKYLTVANKDSAKQLLIECLANIDDIKAFGLRKEDLLYLEVRLLSVISYLGRKDN